jgi:hypothetical protein
VLKLFGLAMATAVFLDAIVIRTILLLAVLELPVPSPVGREPATAARDRTERGRPANALTGRARLMTSLREHSGPSIESVIREKQTLGTREIAVVGAAASREC